MDEEKDYTFSGYNRNLIPAAKKLRKNMTPQEKHLWFGFLRAYPVRILRQKAFGRCIADFYCSQAKLVIEIDGSQHYTEEGLAYDRERSGILRQQGIDVLRFANSQVEEEFEHICRKIDHVIRERIKQRTPNETRERMVSHEFTPES